MVFLRLGVLTALQVHGALDFTTLRKHLEVKDGALGMHLRKLEESGYIACEKSFVGRRPKSTYRISNAGKRELHNYLDAMQAIIDSVKQGDGARER